MRQKLHYQKIIKSYKIYSMFFDAYVLSFTDRCLTEKDRTKIKETSLNRVTHYTFHMVNISNSNTAVPSSYLFEPTVSLLPIFPAP